MHAVIVPRRSCFIYFLFCQANNFIHSFIQVCVCEQLAHSHYMKMEQLGILGLEC